MAKRKNKSYANILPDDEDLIKRSIWWGSTLEKLEEEEDKESEYLRFDYEIPDKSMEKSVESVDPLVFETNEKENDSDYDFEAILNKTKVFVEKRKEEWHDSGLDRVMDSFNLTNIENKVGKWLNNDTNCFFKNLISKKPTLPDSFVNEEVKIQNHEIYTDNDSVDTAKYILSSRKRSKSKITTMTIKHFRYSNRKKANESNDSFLKGCKMYALEDSPKNNMIVNSENESIYSNNLSKGNSKIINKKLSTNLKKLKSRDSIKSSSSREKYENGCSECNTKLKKKLEISSYKKHREPSRKSFKRRNILHSKENNKISSSSETSTSTPPKKNFRKNSKIRKSFNNSINNIIDSDTSVQSEINFNEKNVVNSTVINNVNKVAKNARKLTKIIDQSDSLQETNKKNGSATNKNNNSPIILYEPDNSKLSSSINITKFVVTKKLLTDKIGEDLADKFLNGEKEIVREFDSSSKIIFYPPESGNSSNSETDFLDKVFKRKGRLVEVVDLI